MKKCKFFRFLFPFLIFIRAHALFCCLRLWMDHNTTKKSYLRLNFRLCAFFLSFSLAWSQRLSLSARLNENSIQKTTAVVTRGLNNEDCESQQKFNAQRWRICKFKGCKSNANTFLRIFDGKFCWLWLLMATELLLKRWWDSINLKPRFLPELPARAFKFFNLQLNVVVLKLLFTIFWFLVKILVKFKTLKFRQNFHF